MTRGSTDGSAFTVRAMQYMRRRKYNVQQRVRSSHISQNRVVDAIISKR